MKAVYIQPIPADMRLSVDLFIFKVTEPSSIPYGTHSACAKRAANPDPPPVIPLPESIATQAVYQLRYKSRH